jgi:hypothetical protein
MSWPAPLDYSAAIQAPGDAFLDPELQQGQAAPGPMGLPLLYAGSFAAVFQVRCPGGQTWAVKCFTRAVPDLQERYRAISAHLEGRRLPFMVEFRYLQEGIRVNGAWYPVVKMRWIEGLTLNEFLREHAGRPAVLEQLGSLWLRLARQLRGAGVAHGDLHPGNVLLVQKPDARLALYLIDYDGMFVPALAGRPPDEVGHPDFQHPRRQRQGGYDAGIDRFSHLVIWTALRGLAVAGPGLWDRHDNGSNLLFCQKDFTDPGGSPLFRSLLALPDPRARALAGRLLRACQGPLEQVPNLADVAATAVEEAPRRAPPTRLPEEQPFPVANAPGSPGRRTRQFVAGTVVGLLLMISLALAVSRTLGQREEQRAEADARPAATIQDTAPPPPPRDHKKSKSPTRAPDRPKTQPPKGGAARGKKEAPRRPAPAVPPPSTERVVLATYRGPHADLPGVLLRRPARATGPDRWEKVARGAPVRSTDTLLSLPGFTAVVQTSSGLSLLLRGEVPAFALGLPQEFLLESAVILHASKDVDLDLTLLRGRIFLTNRKTRGPARVRLRLDDDSWDVTLAEPGAEVGVDYFALDPTFVNYRLGAPPRSLAYLALLSGEATVAVDGVWHTRRAVAPGAYLFSRDSFRKPGEPLFMDRLPPGWYKKPPADQLSGDRLVAVKDMSAALKDLQGMLTGSKPLPVTLQEAATKKDTANRNLAICCLGAIDDLGRLVDHLGDESLYHAPDRLAAVHCLRRWLSRSAELGKLLFDDKRPSGVLIDRGYRGSEARAILELLCNLPAGTDDKLDTFLLLAGHLQGPHVALAELAYFHLLRLARGAKLPAFNAAAPLEERRRFAETIMDMVLNKPLPPPPAAEKARPRVADLRLPGNHSPAEIYSAAPLNRLFKRLVDAGKLNQRPNVPLDSSTLAPINLTDKQTRGNIGLLRRGRKLSWPAVLLTPPFDQTSKTLTETLTEAVKLLEAGKLPPAATLNEAERLRKALVDRLGEQIDTVRARYFEGKRYLDHLAEALRALRGPQAVNHFNGTWAPRGKNVAELLEHMRKHGLQFAPATPGDESAYAALFQSMQSFAAGSPAPGKPPRRP